MKIYKSRNEIPEKYKWDLLAILKRKSPEFYFKKIKSIGKYLTDNKTNYVETKESFMKYLKKENEFSLNEFIYENWLSNNISVDIVNKEIRKLSEEFSFWKYNFSKKHANSINFIIKNEKKIREYLLDDKLKEYRFTYDCLFKKKKHILSPIEEQLMSKMSRAICDVENQFSILSNTELIYKDVKDSKNKSYKLTDGNYSTLIKSNDSVLRKNVYNEYWDCHLKHKESFSTMIYEHKKTESTIANIRKYKSSIDMLISSDFVDEKLLHNIYDVVSKKSIIVHKYHKVWKKNYYKKFKKTPKIWDTSINLIYQKKKYTIEQAKQIVLDALEPFGIEYTNKIKEAYEKKWIDFLPVKNKRTGAYSIGNTYGINRKYICMNFDNQFRSVETLAHELGHSMHSYYSDKNNSLIESQYEILVAEIASTFNELMLSDYMLKKAKSDIDKFFIIEKLIVGAIGSIHRQSLWSEYEFELYKSIDAGKPVNSHHQQQIIYQKMLNKYSGTQVKKKIQKSDLAGSFYVPHYYYGFYVYKYVVGMTGAYAFFSQYKKKGKIILQNYIKNFLSTGCKGKPLDRLKKAGVDLCKPEVLYNAFNILDSYVKEYKLLSRKIFGK